MRFVQIFTILKTALEQTAEKEGTNTIGESANAAQGMQVCQPIIICSVIKG
jgi:hypothetical protein